ncbi:polysaccharide deacetylase family protein [Paenibacillus thermotolerans]|uniref:polysaccharide deacetylase family protein n=1 Tax=Paenibacillus thermotolerans TaxID=3027807 RepID=UPI002368A829|nr:MULTISPECIES: polysaccharide deacetylase family protein [unclassified Paenibacillus]
MSNLLLWLFYFFTFYAFLPGLVSRLFGFRVFKRGISDKDISLTFDDGPDPVYTPKLLDLLKKHGVKATFFIVGKHAEEHPDIIKRMHQEGHLIGIHNYKHRSNWLMRPKSVVQSVQRTSQLIERFTGEPSQFYRPPWGIMNIFDYSTRHQLQIVLWSVMLNDWKKSTGAARIREKMLKHLKGGQIYLLHDCGNTFGADLDAPQNTIAALGEFIPIALEKGYRFARVDDLMQVTARMTKKNPSLAKRFVVGGWLAWERIFHALFRLQPANPTDSHSFLHFRLIKYSGEKIRLNEGIELEKGDRVVELHMDNALLYELGKKSRSPVQLAIQLIRQMEQTMPQLASIILKRPDASSIKAIMGVTMVNRGVEQFGFTVTELPKGLFAALTKLYLRLLLSVIHPQGADRLAERKEMLIPKRIAISMHEVDRRYGGGDPLGDETEPGSPEPEPA